MRRPFVTILAATGLPVAAGAGASSQEQPRRPPEAHDRGGPRTDVIDIGSVIAPDHYVAPVADWRYRPLRIGERLPSAFLEARYRIADPQRFDLGDAGAGRRWIRYGDDLVLVSCGSGQVVRTVRNGYRRS